ncbi:hypothetical protein [Serratia fonticola]|uniref:hypothetical protein n=1 Tax=Serratia fonticola TaxID=47917 RepID=UPI0024DEA670|nr:hypothetical protein [Serratia fonticola]MDK2377302.1 hypothetical protein [Serratia fonticola]
MAKSNQQSKSGWGGKRPGAGAPLGNTNAVKHGERSRRAFTSLVGRGQLPPLVSLRASNLMIAERVGELSRLMPSAAFGSTTYRELMLLDGIMWQRARRMSRIELGKTKLALNLTLLELARAKSHLMRAMALKAQQQPNGDR